MDTSLVIDALEELLEGCLTPATRASLAVDAGRAAGMIEALIHLNLISHAEVEDYAHELQIIMTMLDLGVIEF